MLRCCSRRGHYVGFGKVLKKKTKETLFVQWKGECVFQTFRTYYSCPDTLEHFTFADFSFLSFPFAFYPSFVFGIYSLPSLFIRVFYTFIHSCSPSLHPISSPTFPSLVILSSHILPFTHSIALSSYISLPSLLHSPCQTLAHSLFLHLKPVFPLVFICFGLRGRSVLLLLVFL